MPRLFLLAGLTLLSAAAMAEKADWQPANRVYDRDVLSAAPLLPADLDAATRRCEPGTGGLEDVEYRSAAEVDYSQHGWEQRVAADWAFFNVSPYLGKVLVIDSRRQGDTLAFRYLANGTQGDLYEPWSSSKVMAFTAAMAAAREQGVGADASVGDYRIADLVTSVHSYAQHGLADGNSNAIASWFLNIAGRDAATALFHDRWLKLSDPRVRIRGAYANLVFDPGTTTWRSDDGSATATIDSFKANTDDPGYQAYRCDDCDLTGNKPMTTLAEAEWLKRLATHDTVPETRHPGLQSSDIDVLFEGLADGPDRPVGGMRAGIGRMLHRALADAIVPEEPSKDDAKAVLDNATDGRWSVWQKLGAGPSETRGASELVMLAQVCLPGYQGGRTFTVAAQAGVPGATEENVSVAAQRLEQVLAITMRQLLGDG
ncbi:hypothetical protein F3N42_06250 [Marinihelvus fidelis]|uniref:Serine hydrolase n=1 Tax=Marinihelvus fidelis TaxID=2613842 RepID=A0A5N0TDQ0_9GAMM|nr:hypothetical protein [Marinihelvus fidelis]KAA9132808.1 hypothetical protein F3N42_06250 [Marinihelvus fidelis]